MPRKFICLGDIQLLPLQQLLSQYELILVRIEDNQTIPGSYWGEPEAGLIGNQIYARNDTPVHSILHEACHLIVLPKTQRSKIHTNASDSVLEEDATCYLQIVLANKLPEIGSATMMADMDDWGYSFRLGSARAWFENDAEETRLWLLERGLL